MQYRRLLTEVEATVARDVLLGWRDVAMVRLLGDAGLRIEELLALDRGDFVPKRKGAKLRAIRVRHGKGNRRRTVELTPAATAAVRRWDERRNVPIGRWHQLILSALALTAAATLTLGCSGAAAQRSLIDYRRTGGFAGLDDHLTIERAGRARLTQRAASHQGQLGPKTRRHLARVLKSADFPRLKSRYESDRPVPDALSYRITHHGRTVQTTDTAIPKALRPTLAILDDIVAHLQQGKRLP